MANYTAADIKALRERTGAGMLDVKKALDEAGGDADKALEIIRVKGLKGVAKREGRSTSEGLVAVDIRDTEGGQVSTLIELNSETDFVAKNDTFISLADRVLKAAAEAGARDADAALATDAAGEAVAKDVAQHVAAMSPTYLSRDEVPAETVENERRIAEETSRNEGKPEAALPKIIEGRLGGFFKDVVLVDQPLAKDPKKTVGQVVTEAGGTITEFVRYRVGA